MSCWACTIYIILPSFRFCSCSPVLFLINYQVPEQPRGGIAAEPLCCHSGHWRPINENSDGDFLPIGDYGEWQEPSLSYLGCSSQRKDVYFHTVPASSSSAPHSDKRPFDPPYRSRYFKPDILDGLLFFFSHSMFKEIVLCFHKCSPCLSNS